MSKAASTDTNHSRHLSYPLVIAGRLSAMGVGVMLGAIMLMYFDYSDNAKAYIPFVGFGLVLIGLLITIFYGRKK